jgi:hypothetical protein
MAFFKKHTALFFVLFFLAGVGLTATVFAASPGWASSPKDAGWTSLTFNASRMLAKLTVQIKIQSPAPMTDGLLTRMGAGLTGSAATVKKMKLMAVDLRAEGQSFFNEQYSEKIWFDAVDGQAYRRIRWRKGGDPWVKIYSWTDQGVRRQKIQPAGRYERNQPPIKWTRSSESFYPYPQNTVKSRAISDPTCLLYLLSSLDPQNLKSPVEIFVFGKEQLHRLTCRREKSPPLTVSFNTHSSAGTARINATISPIVFSVTAESSAYAGRESETFSLLGLEKDIRITVDPSTHLPIRVSGKNPLWGELVLDLSEVQRF